MSFSIQIKGSAARELQTLAKPDRIRIIKAIDLLAENPFSGKALKGRLRGLRSLRARHFRVLYEVHKNALIVLVISVAHQSGVYR